MRKVWALVGALAAAALLLALVLLPPPVASEQKVGFDPAKLVRPAADLAPATDNSLPGNRTSSDPVYKVQLGWNMTADVYAFYGGSLDLTITNNDPTESVFIYGVGLRWDSDGTAYLRDCRVIIPPCQQATVGPVIFGAPDGAGLASYKIVLQLAASDENGTVWHDYGTVYWDALAPVTIQPLGTPSEYTIVGNPSAYYDRVNEKIDLPAVSSIVGEIKEKYPGDYSVLQIAEAYQWVKDHIAYKEDASGDYWQTPTETLSRGTGDCEDQAFLMASIVTALGGNARVNIISEHAFPTVFIGTTMEDVDDAAASLASYYGMDVSEYKMAYLHDDLGYWLVIDTSGYPYAGGIPAKSVPTGADGDWTMLSPYLYPVDVAGLAGSGGWPF